MCIFCCTFAHVYILPHILHHRANALPYSGMADLLDHSTPMPPQHTFRAICIYRVGTCGNLLRHHALWLLVWAKAVACNRNQLYFAASTRSLQHRRSQNWGWITTPVAAAIGLLIGLFINHQNDTKNDFIVPVVVVETTGNSILDDDTDYSMFISM